jgi:hypothetical protein
MAEGHDTSPHQQRCATRIEKKNERNKMKQRTKTKRSISDEKK